MVFGEYEKETVAELCKTVHSAAAPE